MADGAAPQGKAPGAEAGSAAVERRGTTFVVENATQGEAVIEITNRKQRVEISRCSGCAVTVKGKALCLALSHCQRVTVLFDQTQKVDVSHCERVEVQCLQGDTQGLEVHVDSCGDFTLFVPEELTDPAKELQVKTSVSRRRWPQGTIRGSVAAWQPSRMG